MKMRVWRKITIENAFNQSPILMKTASFDAVYEKLIITSCKVAKTGLNRIHFLSAEWPSSLTYIIESRFIQR